MLLGLSIASLTNLKSKKVIKPISIIEPINPKLLEYTANIKSVWGSGKYIGVLFKPYPINPPLPIAVIPFSNWYPLPLDQSSNLSTLRKKDEPNILIKREDIVNLYKQII